MTGSSSFVARFLCAPEYLCALPRPKGEANAVEDGVNALEKELQMRSLRTFRLRGGPTPRQLQSGLVHKSRRQEKGGNDASGMG
jgi:hypothetical protein